MCCNDDDFSDEIKPSRAHTFACEALEHSYCNGFKPFVTLCDLRKININNWTNEICLISNYPFQSVRVIHQFGFDSSYACIALSEHDLCQVCAQCCYFGFNSCTQRWLQLIDRILTRAHSHAKNGCVNRLVVISRCNPLVSETHLLVV